LGKYAGSAVRGQAKLFQECRVARVLFQALEQRVALDLGETAVAVLEGPVEPGERLVGFVAEGVDTGDLCGGRVPLPLEQFRKGGVGFGLAAEGLLRSRKGSPGGRPRRIFRSRPGRRVRR
jgi:hypothetical protein